MGSPRRFTTSLNEIDTEPLLQDEHEEGPQPSLGEVRFLRPDSPPQPAKVLYIPANVELSQSDIKDIIQKDWKLRLPNMLLKMDFGRKHPSRLAEKTLVSNEYKSGKAFAKLLKTSKAILDHSSRPDKEESEASWEITDDELEMINEHLFSKIVTILSALLQASEVSNNWIVIDRRPQVPDSPSAELLLEMAKLRGETKPIILVVDSMERLRNNKSPASKDEVSLWEARVKSFAPRSSCSGGIPSGEIALPAYDVESFKDAERFENEREYPDYWNVPADRKRSKWWHYYREYVFSAASHYVLLETNTQHFTLDTLAPIGQVFANGGLETQERLLNWMLKGQPTSLLHNTGGCTQAFVLIRNYLVANPDTLDDEDTDADALADARLEVQEICQEIQVACGEERYRKFGLSEIELMRDLQSRDPKLLEKTIVPVDTVKDQTDSAVRKFMNCFSSMARLPEVGLGNAEQELVLCAWNQHMLLNKNAEIARQQKDKFYSIVTTLSCLSSLTALFAMWLNTDFAPPEAANEPLVWQILDTVILFLPIALSIATAIMTKQNNQERWVCLLLSAAAIVREIYMFRLRACTYDEANVSLEDSDDEMGPKNPSRIVRLRFRQRVEDIFAVAVNHDADSHTLTKFSRISAHDSLCKHIDKLHLDKYIETKVLHPPRRRNPAQMMKLQSSLSLAPPAGELHEEPPGKNHEQHEDKEQKRKRKKYEVKEDKDDDHEENEIQELLNSDDHRSPMMLPAYIESRAKRLLIAYEDLAQVLERNNRIMDIFNYIIASMSTAFAAFQMYHYVTLCVSIATLVSNLKEYLRLPQRLAAANSAARDLENLVTWWSSLSFVDKLTRQAKNKAVLVCETAVMNDVVAWVGSTLEAATGFENEDEAEGEGGDAKQGGRKAKQNDSED